MTDDQEPIEEMMEKLLDKRTPEERVEQLLYGIFLHIAEMKALQERQLENLRFINEHLSDLRDHARAQQRDRVGLGTALVIVIVAWFLYKSFWAP